MTVMECITNELPVKVVQPATKTELLDLITEQGASATIVDDIIKKIADSKLKRSEEEQVLKAVKRVTGISLTSMREDIKSLKGEFEEPEADHLDFAKDVISSFGEENIIFSSGSAWLWRGVGVWEMVEDQVIKQEVHKTLMESNSDNSFITASGVNSITDLVKTETYQEDKFSTNARDIINTKNGELHFIQNRWQLKEHNRENYLTALLPVVYDEKAKAPRFEQFLNEVFESDPDINDKKTVLLQMMGYSLLQNCRYETFAMLIGSGANGKSVLLEVLRSLIGAKAVSAVQPSQFDNKFQRGHLEGKLVNIVTEIAEGSEIKDAELKAIVSGELTTAERKFKPPFEFLPYATCWFGTNHMPHTRDFSDALFRRAVILTFNNTFYGPRRDPKLKEKLVNELPGILNLALSALTQLLNEGAFVEPESSEEAKRIWRIEADQVAQFVDECCEEEKGSKVTSNELYRNYIAWANNAGINRHLNRNNFTKRLKNKGFEAGKGGKGVRMITGIKIVIRY